MGHSLNRTSFRINQNLVIDDKTFNPGYILVSDIYGNASWQNPSKYINNDEPLERFIGELYGGGVVVAVWKETAPVILEITIVASVRNFNNTYLAWSATNNVAIGPPSRSHTFGASNSYSIIAQNNTAGYAATACYTYINEDLYGLGVYDDWYLPSTFELNCLANNAAIVDRVISQYATDKSLLPFNAPASKMTLFENRNDDGRDQGQGYWTSTEYDAVSAYYLNVGADGGARFALSSKSNTKMVRPFRTDIKMYNNGTWVTPIWNPIDETWVVPGTTGNNPLAPFEYMIATYYLDVDGDLDTCSYLTGTGITSIDNLPLGCGYYTPVVGLKQSTGGKLLIGPNIDNTSPAAGATQGSSYLYWAGDDAGNNKGESILINFENLKNGQPTSNRNVGVDLRASWHTNLPGSLISIEITTYNGGVLSTPTDINGEPLNTILSTGTIVQRVRSPKRPVPYNVCDSGQSGNLNYRPLVARVNYNLDTKSSSITFY